MLVLLATLLFVSPSQPSPRYGGDGYRERYHPSTFQVPDDPLPDPAPMYQTDPHIGEVQEPSSYMPQPVYHEEEAGHQTEGQQPSYLPQPVYHQHDHEHHHTEEHSYQPPQQEDHNYYPTTQEGQYGYGYPAPQPHPHPPPPPPPPPQPMMPVPTPGDAAKQQPAFTYYYLGRHLWYIPLYFSIYFIIYVGALVLKAIARHKILFPAMLQEAAAATSRSDEALRAIHTASKRYYMK